MAMSAACWNPQIIIYHPASPMDGRNAQSAGDCRVYRSPGPGTDHSASRGLRRPPRSQAELEPDAIVTCSGRSSDDRGPGAPLPCPRRHQGCVRHRAPPLHNRSTRQGHPLSRNRSAPTCAPARHGARKGRRARGANLHRKSSAGHFQQTLGKSGAIPGQSWWRAGTARHPSTCTATQSAFWRASDGDAQAIARRLLPVIRST